MPIWLLGFKLEFLPDSNRRPRDWQFRALTNWASFTSSWIKVTDSDSLGSLNLKDIRRHAGPNEVHHAYTCAIYIRGTHACKASKLGPVEDPLPGPDDGDIYCISLIRFAFRHVSENSPLRYLFYDTMHIYFCFLCQYCTWRRHGFAYIC